MMGREGSMRTHPEINVPDPITAHPSPQQQEWIEKVAQVNTMHMELFAGFIRR
jgi:hypothetical protein